MTAALAEPIVERPKTPTLVPSPIQSEPKQTAADRYPLLPVFIAAFLGLNGAALLVGTILMWLALRHTGINASW